MLQVLQFITQRDCQLTDDRVVFVKVFQQGFRKSTKLML